MLVSDDQIKELTKLFYLGVYSSSGPWEGLSEKARDDFVQETKVFLDCVEKINLKVVPASAELRPRREVEITQVENFIRDFIKNKVQKPVGLVGVFPYQQLARDLVDEFKI